MKKKRFLIPIIILGIFVGYFAIRLIAKNAYENRIDDKIDYLCSERFRQAISVSYPFLWESMSTIQSRANAIKYIASEAGYDRYVFSVLWKKYQNTQKGNRECLILWDMDFFVCSNAYRSLTYTRSNLYKESNSIENLMTAGKLVFLPENIVEMDSILHAADIANGFTSDFAANLSEYRDFSHNINDWRKFDAIDYNIEISYYYKLKEKPFSLYEYFFDNPLDKEDSEI